MVVVYYDLARRRFLRIVRDFSGNVPGEGGLITFPESNWLASIVIPHQPHFIGQPDGVSVFWGYGLSVDNPGNFVTKPMSACTGREIMTEVLGHLHAEADASKILETSICIPCIMPFVTSQFLRREKGDRPQIVPMGSKNLALPIKSRTILSKLVVQVVVNDSHLTCIQPK